MPEKKTTQRARRDRSQGKKATTQAGHFVGEEIRHKRSGKHPVKSRKQAIAIGLSKARRAGVKVPKKGGKSAKKTGTSGYSKRKSSSSSRKSSGSSRSKRGSSGRSSSGRRSSRSSRSRSKK